MLGWLGIIALGSRKCLSAECGFTITEVAQVLVDNAKSQMPFGGMRFYDFLLLLRKPLKIVQSQMPFSGMRFYDKIV